MFNEIIQIKTELNNIDIRLTALEEKTDECIGRLDDIQAQLINIKSNEDI